MSLSIHRVAISISEIITADNFAVGKTSAAESWMIVIDAGIDDSDRHTLSVEFYPCIKGVHQWNALGKCRIDNSDRLDMSDIWINH